LPSLSKMVCEVLLLKVFWVGSKGKEVELVNAVEVESNKAEMTDFPVLFPK